MSEIAYVIVRVVIKDGEDVQEVIADTDYAFKHEAILDTEIIEVSDQPGG